MRVVLRNIYFKVDRNVHPYDVNHYDTFKSHQKNSKNRWKSQQIAKAIADKRDLGIYYRKKENKTWKHKLRKRRRSKRRNLQKQENVDYKSVLHSEETCNQWTVYNAPNNITPRLKQFELNEYIKTDQRKIRKKKRNKRMNNKFDDFESYWNTMQQHIKSIKSTHFLKKKKKCIGINHKQELLKKCIKSINDFKNYVTEMNIEYLIKNEWIQKLNKYEFNIVYTTDIKHWTQSSKFINFPNDKYNEHQLKQILKNDPILKHCDNEMLVCGYFESSKHGQIPYDIMVLCSLYCGVISSLLPYKFDIECDFGRYYNYRNTEIGDISNGISQFKASRNIYICLSLLDGNRYNNIIPLFKIYTLKPSTLEFHGFGFKGLKFKKMMDIQRMIELKKRKEYICSLSGKIMSHPVRGPHIFVGDGYKIDCKWYEKTKIEQYVRYHGKSPNGGYINPRIEYVYYEICGPEYNWSASCNHSANQLKQEIDAYREFVADSKENIFQLFCELFCR